MDCGGYRADKGARPAYRKLRHLLHYCTDTNAKPAPLLGCSAVH